MAKASIKIDVDVNGIAKAIRQISKFDITTQQRVKDTVNKHALNIQSLAKKNLTKNGSVDTGRLRSSIAMEPYNEGLTIRVGSALKYAPYVEYGTGKFAKNGSGRKTPWVYKNRKGDFIWTRGQKPKPYLHPAAEADRKDYINDMKQVLKNIKV